MKVKDLIKWLQEKNPEADIYIGEADGAVCHKFRGLESFLDQEGKEQTVLINYDKKKINKEKFYVKND
jgi:hypothetical protein